MKNFIFILLSCLFSSIILSDNNHNLMQKTTIACINKAQIKESIDNKIEGFLENTLIKTPYGYRYIQDLEIGDFICENSQNKIITNKFQQKASQFVQLSNSTITIEAACQQRFYAPSHDQWIEAYAITSSDIILSHGTSHITFDTIKTIYQPVDIYCITVQDHLFTVSTDNVLVHNSAAALIAPYITLTFIEIAHPIAIFFGSIISLKHFRSYAPQTDDSITSTSHIASPEKMYFDAKYKELSQLKKDIVTIHSGLKTIKCSLLDQQSLLTYYPYALIKNNLDSITTVTAEWENKLDFEDRFALTEIREKILNDLETEICNTQINIGLFVNEFVHRKNETIKFYNNFIDKNTDRIHRQPKLPLQAPYAEAKKYYQHAHVCNVLISEIIDRQRELSTVIQFFEKHTKSTIIRKTTNINIILDQEKQSIEADKTTINTSQQSNETKIQSALDYFRHHRLTPDATQQIAITKAALYNSFQKDIKSRSTGQQYPKNTPPQKPNDDDKEIPRVFVGAKYHSSTGTNSKSAAPKNGQLALDCSLQIGPRMRVGISENQIVILGRTLIKPQGGSEWHGYAISWENLNKEQKETTKNTLIRNGLVNSHGKIL